MSQPLPKPLCGQLESIVKVAHEVAERGAHAALSQLGVCEKPVPPDT